MEWKVIISDTFSKEFKKFKRDSEFIKNLDSKIKRLEKDPENVGDYLSGKLHGYKSARIIKNYRLVFKIVKENNQVRLMAIDHRKFDYDRFDFD